jgi:hypothetical protein
LTSRAREPKLRISRKTRRDLQRMTRSIAHGLSSARRGLVGILAGACLTSIFLLSPVHAQNGVLTGTVAGADGTPKSFARVQLQGAARFAAVSDVSGKFTINNFAPGTYASSQAWPWPER